LTGNVLITLRRDGTLTVEREEYGHTQLHQPSHALPRNIAPSGAWVEPQRNSLSGLILR
jgi:hypothetical protein